MSPSEVKKTLWAAGAELIDAVVTTRKVTLRRKCVDAATVRCCRCGARWTARIRAKGGRFRGSPGWRRCPRGCNAHLLKKH